MNYWLIFIFSIAYLLILFGIASFVENKKKRKKNIINNAYIYALSLAVYCTAWTFFGSIGRATTTGIEFIYIYLGPSLLAPFVIIILKKIIRISKTQRITNLADFISTRYGKNITIGMLVTFLCVIGIIPYIAIQLKAIFTSIDIISSGNYLHNNFKNITTLFIILGLIFFVILFGTRNIDSTERHEGMVAAIAFESIIKISAFLLAGIYIVFIFFNGWGDLLNQTKLTPQYNNLINIQGSTNDFFHFFCFMVLSMFAVLFLPRQFQISVVENIHEEHLKKAIWLFPLYLFIINIFVLPIAMAGVVVFKNTQVNADTFILALPIFFKNTWLTLVVYIGGFSAASSMIIVETIALATMISNNIITPLFFSFSTNKENLNINFRNRLKLYRWISIICIILLSYLFEIYIAEKLSLVSIGLISFAAVAQFAPAMLGGIYWKNATKNGALIGIIAGFIVWFYTLILPALISAGYIEKSFLINGPFHIGWLKPTALFGLENIEFISHGFFWSVLINFFCYVGFSVFSNRNPQEIYQAEIFVDIFKAPNLSDNTQFVWNRTADLNTLKLITANFLGNSRTKQILLGYSKKFNLNLNNLQIAPPHLIQYIERLLAGHIGSAAAKIMITKIVNEKALSTEEVLQIIKETQQIKASNIELKKESAALNKLTDELKSVNFQLKKMDQIKDEFLYTVTHEIRTPLTSIRALSEIMQDNADLSEDEKTTYLNAIVKETERLTHLITQVLNLERYESGRHKLNISNFDIEEQFIEIINTTDSIRKEKKIQIQLAIPSLPNIYADVDLLKQVFYNLITNAIKFAKSTITITINIESNNLIIQVKDDGVGIDETLHQLIFDKFFQAKNQTLKKPEGSGLGLAICKKIIELHQGKIWVESNFGFGATFIISLPNCIKLNK